MIRRRIRTQAHLGGPPSGWRVPKQICRTGRRPKSSASMEGFALIDVLVGLAMIGVISALMIVFLGQARTMMRIQKTTEMQMEVDAAARFLETAIGSAEPLPLSQSTPDMVLYLSGTGARIEFNAVQAIGFRSSALREIAVSLGSDLTIIQKIRRGTDAAKAAGGQPVRLIAGVSAVRFEYLDASAKVPSWSASWAEPRRLPAAVRFTISVVRDGATYSSAGFARLDLADIQPPPAKGGA